MRLRTIQFVLGITLLALVWLFCSVNGYAQGFPVSGEALKASSGQPSAPVRVCAKTATGTPCFPLASIYSDEALTMPKANPFYADANGNYSYYASAGIYKEQVGSGSSAVTRMVALGGGSAAVDGQAITPQSVNGIRYAEKYASVQAAIDSFGAAPACGTVMLPKGVVSVSSTISVTGRSGCRILGHGATENGTVLRWSGAADGTILELNNTNSSALDGFMVDGDDTAGRGIYIHGTSAQPQNNSVRDVYVLDVKGTPGYGIQNGSGSAGELGAASNLFERVWSEAGKYGFYQGEHGQAVDNTLIHYTCARNSVAGYFIAGGSVMIDSSSGINNTVDVQIEPAALWVNINALEIEETGGLPVYLPTGSRSWPTTITGSRFTQGQANADLARFYQTGEVTLIGNRWEGTGGGTNQVILNNASKAVIYDYNSQFVNNATLTNTSSKFTQCVSGTCTVYRSGLNPDAQYRIERGTSGYGRFGLMSNGAWGAAFGEDAANPGEAKIYAGTSLTEVLRINSAGVASLQGSTPTLKFGTNTIIPATVTGFQGTATKIMSAGNVSGTGAALCTDANGGATTDCSTSVAGSGTATFEAGAAAGTTPGTPTCATGVVCDSVSGIVSMTTGTTPGTSGTILTITLGGVTRTNKPTCLGFAQNQSTGQVTPLYTVNSTTTTCVLGATGSALAGSTLYGFSYFVAGK